MNALEISFQLLEAIFGDNFITEEFKVQIQGNRGSITVPGHVSLAGVSAIGFEYFEVKDCKSIIHF